MEWQPIETAPKDGTSILIYAEDSVIEAYFSDDLNEWSPVTLDCHGCGCCGMDYPTPEYWMPLPDAPIK